MSVSWQIAVLGVVALFLIGAAVWILIVFRITPERRERKRRLVLHQRGRLGGGIITEANENTIFYSYAISGVAYTASQRIDTLYDHLPSDPERLVGPVSLKYVPNNPANSIVVCEFWSGLRVDTKTREILSA